MSVIVSKTPSNNVADKIIQIWEMANEFLYHVEWTDFESDSFVQQKINDMCDRFSMNVWI